jgi:hypothetical protein
LIWLTRSEQDGGGGGACLLCRRPSPGLERQKRSPSIDFLIDNAKLAAKLRDEFFQDWCANFLMRRCL